MYVSAFTYTHTLVVHVCIVITIVSECYSISALYACMHLLT